MAKAVYIHIPFCTHICHYCDFNKVFLKGQPVDRYIDALILEIEKYIEQFVEPIETIFLGGGTPTALTTKQLDHLLTAVQKLLPIHENVEFTIEANPGDLPADKLRVLKDLGVNRLSLGVQTFNNELLKRIGRSHRVKDVYETVEAAKRIGFDNISIDLMYGLPGQKIKDVEDSLKETFSLDIQHCSAYSLIVEPKTVFYNLLQKGKLPLPGEDVEGEMYELIMAEMEAHGLHQYEISNYAKPGYESRHNLVYWNNEEYFGFGAGAHGYLNGVRQANIYPINKYIQTVEGGDFPVRSKTTLTEKERMEEEMFLGLRKTAGVSIDRFREKFGRNLLDIYGEQIERLVNRKLITITENSIRLTKAGKMVGNEVFMEFIG